MSKILGKTTEIINDQWFKGRVTNEGLNVKNEQNFVSFHFICKYNRNNITILILKLLKNCKTLLRRTKENISEYFYDIFLLTSVIFV